MAKRNLGSKSKNESRKPNPNEYSSSEKKEKKIEKLFVTRISSSQMRLCEQKELNSMERLNYFPQLQLF